MIKKIGLIALILIGGSAGGYIVGNGGFQNCLKNFTSNMNKPVPPSFYPINKLMISLKSTDEESHYMALDVDLKVSATEVEQVKMAEPLIKNILIQTYGIKTIKELSKANEINHLQNNGMLAINKILKQNNFSLKIKGIVFTRMVFQ